MPPLPTKAHVVAAILVMAMLPLGCIATAPAVDGDPDGPPGAPDATAGREVGVDVGGGGGEVPPDAPASVFDPAAQPVRGAPTRVYTSEGWDAGVMQGGDHDLVWTGRVYLVAWLQNLEGRIHVIVQAIDPSRGAPVSALHRVSPPDYEASPHSVRLIVDDQGPAVAWSTSGGGAVWRQRLREDGRPLAGAPELIWGGPGGRYVGLPAIGHGGPEWLLFLATDGGEAAPALWLEPAGGASGPTPGLHPARAALVRWDGGWSALWGWRRPPYEGDDHEVYLTRFGVQGGPPIQTTLLATGRTVGPSLLGPPGGPPTVAALGGFYEGLRFLGLDEGTIISEQEIFEGGAHQRWLLRHAPSQATQVGVVHQAGTYRETNPLSTEVWYHALDYATGTVGAAVLLNAETANTGRCIEAVSLALVDAQRVGVAWAEGCDARTLSFTEVRAR
jgi:hypothetical protein